MAVLWPRKGMGAILCQSYGEWRSPAARRVRDAEVGGSNPLSPTKQDQERAARPLFFVR
jgi:hypothetical protein